MATLETAMTEDATHSERARLKREREAEGEDGAGAKWAHASVLGAAFKILPFEAFKRQLS